LVICGSPEADADDIAVVGASVVGTAVVGAFVVGASVVGASVVGASVVGASVVGTAVAGASVVGVSVVGVSVVGTAVGASVGASVGACQAKVFMSLPDNAASLVIDCQFAASDEVDTSSPPSHDWPPPLPSPKFAAFTHCTTVLALSLNLIQAAPGLHG